ncbi:pantetheine-phosphate adenylyltransferase [Candidatus Woesearchaeota archaeon]|nr:pantetheine-phosphate adenylyltransferase [Candidatus Woesearchaeota archaeon]
MTKAMYAFSGDPITYGHIDVVERTAKFFDEMIVGIGVHPEKTYLFSLEERTEMAQKALAHLPNVKVVSFKGLLVDYAYENNVGVIVRGVRNEKDFDYETSLHGIGYSQRPTETFLLIAKPELSLVSSSTAKSIQKEYGDLTKYVPLNVKQKLEEKISGQYLVGIAGGAGSGKSYVSKKLAELGKEKNVDVHLVDLDKIGHKILGEWIEPLYVKIREQITQTFGNQVKQNDGFINRKELGDIVFNNEQKWNQLDEIMKEPMIRGFKKEIYGKKGLILVEGAIMIEKNWTNLLNHNIILVSADEQSRQRRLKERGWSDERIQQVLDRQYTDEEKKNALGQKIKQDNNGAIFEINNSDSLNNIEEEFNELLGYLKL